MLGFLNKFFATQQILNTDFKCLCPPRPRLTHLSKILFKEITTECPLLNITKERNTGHFSFYLPSTFKGGFKKLTYYKGDTFSLSGRWGVDALSMIFFSRKYSACSDLFLVTLSLIEGSNNIHNNFFKMDFFVLLKAEGGEGGSVHRGHVPFLYHDM